MAQLTARRSFAPHIGIDARLLHYRAGGISEVTTHLIDELARRDFPESITVFASRKARTPLSPHFRQWPLWTPPHHRLERWALSAELLPHRLHLWHATDFIPPQWGAKRWVVSIHDLTFLHYPQFLTPESRRYYNGNIHRAARQADHILTISQASKQDIMALLGVPEDRISVHALAADARYRPLPPGDIEPVLRHLDLPERYFLFVGTFEPRKNILGLAQAYRLLLDGWPDASPLVLAGRRGWLFEDTMAALETLQLGERLRFCENIPADHMPALYNAAWALLLPSHYEGFGLPALEAMACGTLPLVSDRSSLPEVVGNVGLCIAPDDANAWAAAMQRAATDESWRNAQNALALQRAAQFHWGNVADVTLASYRKVA